MNVNEYIVLSAAVGEVQVRDPTLNIVEGSMMDFCAVLSGTTGSPTSLENELTVTFSATLTGKAGRYIYVK